MTKLFIHIYEFFRLHKIFFYAFLVIIVAVMGWFAMQVRFEENVISFLPDTEDAVNASKVFNNLKLKDKIILMQGTKDTAQQQANEIKTQATAE